jgi:hypothetical protein
MYLHELAKSFTDVVEFDPLGIKSSDVSFVLLIYPHSPSVCSMSRADGWIIISGIDLPEIRNIIIVPMGSVTYNEIKIAKYLEGNNSTILTENRLQFRYSFVSYNKRTIISVLLLSCKGQLNC